MTAPKNWCRTRSHNSWGAASSSEVAGVGVGALDAMVQYVRTMKRGMTPQFTTPIEDPLMMRRLAARTFASHDPTDTKNVYIGELPSPASIMRF
ncbi:hypothetical protein ACGFNP_04380 [Nonomuraea sp. NPDC049269]|uniref:hypothetical protein n=1 Tax=Nonomuraea sp. NPDC049269 TaxID=3364349 RepID=UPI00371A6051